MERLIQGLKAGKIQIYLENCNIGGGFKNRNFKRNVHDVFGRANQLVKVELIIHSHSHSLKIFLLLRSSPRSQFFKTSAPKFSLITKFDLFFLTPSFTRHISRNCVLVKDCLIWTPLFLQITIIFKSQLNISNYSL